MKLGSDQNRLTLLAVTALVAHAPILVFPPAHRTWFPNGYERVDIKILEWIRRVSQQSDSAAAATRRRAS